MEFVRPLEPILIIDDVKEIRDYLNQILTELGFEDILESNDYLSAKPLLDKKSPNVIFLDVDLPDSESSDILELGAKGFIEKPFNAKKVNSVMKRLELSE